MTPIDEALALPSTQPNPQIKALKDVLNELAEMWMEGAKQPPELQAVAALYGQANDHVIRAITTLYEAKNELARVMGEQV